MSAKFVVFSGTTSAGGASVAVMTTSSSSSKRGRIERWYVRLHGWNTLPLVGLLSGRPRKKGLVQTAREIPGNLFQITWTGVRSDGLMGAICFIAVEKRPEYGQWGRMVQRIHPPCLSPLLPNFGPAVVLAASAIANRNNKRLACIFSSFAQFPAHGIIIAQRKQKQANEERVETLTSVILFLPPLKVFAHISSAFFPPSLFLLWLATVSS